MLAGVQPGVNSSWAGPGRLPRHKHHDLVTWDVSVRRSVGSRHCGLADRASDWNTMPQFPYFTTPGLQEPMLGQGAPTAVLGTAQGIAAALTYLAFRAEGPGLG